MPRKDWMIRESELDNDQVTVLQSTLNKSLIVSGCAGSGKSVLALIKAQRIEKMNEKEKEKKTYQVIVYTKALCRYMNSGREELGLSNDFVYHRHWQRDLGCPSSDYVVVDEIQDFTAEEIREFIAAGKIVFFFGDTAQSIFDGIPDYNGNPKRTMPVEDIRDLFPDNTKLKCFELYRNYRLPLAVAKFVQSIGVDLPDFIASIYKSPEKALPFVLCYSSLQQQLEAIKDIVQRKSLSDVAILVQTNNLVKGVADGLTALGLNCEMNYRDRNDWRRNNKEELDFTSDNPKVMTYHSAKGLQFEAVFLPCLERFDSTKPSAHKSLYVAATRTYKELYVMYSGSMPQVLKGIDPELYKTSTKEKIASI